MEAELEIELTIHGSPPRKSNRRLWVGERLIKSPEALRYVADLRKQVPVEARQRLSGPIKFTAHIFYSNRQSDLSAELIQDALQDQHELISAGGLTPTGRVKKRRVLAWEGVYRNDNQIVELHLFKHHDSDNPRAEISIEEVDGSLDSELISERTAD
jgi:hypothetical protein